MEEHPYRTAWQTRDVDTWAQALSPDVVMYSPILTRPFRGREAAIELFGVLFDELGEMQITDELSDRDTHAFFWRVRVAAKSIEGVDLLRRDEQGKISEIRVLIRPLPDIAVFAGAIGPALAAKRAPISWSGGPFDDPSPARHPHACGHDLRASDPASLSPAESAGIDRAGRAVVGTCA